MSAAATNSPPTRRPDLNQYREYLAEMAWLGSVQCELITRYAEIGDDKGLEYATRALIAVARSAGGAMKDMKDAKGAADGV